MRHKQRMRFHAAVCAVYTVVALVMAVSAHQEPSAEEKALTERMDAQASGLNKLTARAVTLGDIIDARLKSRADAKLQSRNMMQQLDRLGTGYCKTYEYNCGNQKCISDMLVCDYQDDCGNHADEDSNICVSPAKPGDSFTGSPVFDYCTERKPAKVSVVIKSEDKNAVYAPLTNVEANLIMWGRKDGTNNKDSLPLKGHYTFGSRVLYFYPPEEDHLAVSMRFAAGNNDVIIATVIKELSREECAEFVLTRDK